MKVSEALRELGEEERGRPKVDLGTLAEAHLLPLAYAVLLPLLSNMRGISTTNDMWDSDVDSHDSMRENPSRVRYPEGAIAKPRLVDFLRH